MKEKINEKLDKFYEHTWISVFVTFLVMLTIFKLTGKLFDSTLATYSAALVIGSVISLSFLWLRKGHMYSCGLKKCGIKNLLVVLPYLVVIAGMYAKRWSEFGTELLNPKLLLLAAVVAAEAGVCEEMMVRGLPLGSTLCRQNTRGQFLGLVFFSSALFGLMHLNNLTKGGELDTVLMQTFNAFCAGVAYCAVYLRTGSIVPSIVLHALWDGATFLDPAQLAGDGAAMTTIAVPENTLAGVPVEYQAIYPVIMVMAVCSIGAIELGYGLFLLRKSKWEEIKANFIK